MSQKCYYTLIAINRGDYYQKGGIKNERRAKI